MNCETCNGTMTLVRNQQHYHCQVCNKFEFPTDIRSAEDGLKPSGKATDFKCPKCQTSLEVGQLRDLIDVCFCQNCRGYVIDSESLGHVITELRGSYEGPDDKPRPVDPNEMEQRESCPACLETMDAHPYYGPGNVVIDTCMHCKLVWFDHGELARIIRAPGVRPGAQSAGNQESEALRVAFDKQAKERAGESLARMFFGI